MKKIKKKFDTKKTRNQKNIYIYLYKKDLTPIAKKSHRNREKNSKNAKFNSQTTQNQEQKQKKLHQKLRQTRNREF